MSERKDLPASPAAGTYCVSLARRAIADSGGGPAALLMRKILAQIFGGFQKWEPDWPQLAQLKAAAGAPRQL